MTQGCLKPIDKNSSGPVELAIKAKQDENGNNIFDTYAKKSLYGNNAISVGRKAGTTVGENSFAFGYDVEASNYESHAEGDLTKASGIASHAEGNETLASGYVSHSEGNLTKANGGASHAEGGQTEANGDYSHSEGNFTKANAECSHAEGCSIEADNFSSHACGKYNVSMEAGGNFSNTIGTAFVIGNGTPSAKSNAFSVMFNGITKAASTITASTTADYAEFFEWNDSNPNNEDRVGKFVTLVGDKIAIAMSNEDYILGIVSGAPFVLGNGDCDVWNGMYVRDEFNRLVYESAPKMEIDEETGTMREVFDGDGNLIYEGTRQKLNPNYDPTQKYVSRFDRAEWSPIGMLGVLSVIQDGTCEVNGYCCCNKDGIATACDKNAENAYRVIKKISNQVVRVVFR